MKTKLVLMILASMLFVGHSHVIAQTQSAAEATPMNSDEVLKYESQLQSLQAFIRAAELSLSFDIDRGEFSCAPDMVVMEMADQMALRNLNPAPSDARISSELRSSLELAIGEVRNLIHSAQSSEVCAPANNSKCCRTLGGVHGDVCVTRDNSYCKRTGTQILNCTASSNPCQ